MNQNFSLYSMCRLKVPFVLSHIILHSVISVECMTHRSRDIISLILKVCRWFLLNNKLFIFHDFLYFTFKTSYNNFINFLNSIRAYVRHRAFATLLIKLYHVVDYDSKWSTQFHNDCMLGFF